MWKNSGEIAGNRIDDDGNGYVDDIYGIDAANRDSDPMDDNKHGTHCAGTIGGVGNNGTGVVGVNWQVSIMALKFMTSRGSGTTTAAIECIDYAIRNGAHVMSNSWGGGGSTKSLKDAIDRAENAGILFIAAAGNSGSDNDRRPGYPSSYENENIISVASIDNRDRLSSFSCYGKNSVDVAAPGSAIYSTVPGNSHSSLSGTSMATPHVAGLAALIKASDFSLGWADIKKRILESVVVTSALTGRVLTNGRINAYNAVKDSNPEPKPSVSITGPASGSTVSNTVEITADAYDETGISSVEFYVDDVLLSTDISDPYSSTWDTLYADYGKHTITVTAYNSAGASSSDSIEVRVNNGVPVDTEDPEVAITSPSDGAKVSNVVTINADASDNNYVAEVVFMVNGEVLQNDTQAPYSCSWDTNKINNGAYAITATAYDIAGNSSTSNITLEVNNVSMPDLGIVITSPSSGSTVRGNVLIKTEVTSGIDINHVRFMRAIQRSILIEMLRINLNGTQDL